MNARLVIVTSLLAAGVACSGGSSPPARSRTAGHPPAAGPPAPPLRAVTLSGEAADLEHWRGKAVLAHFWATWCGPCRRELPMLERLSERYAPDGLVVLAISIDDQPDAVRSFLTAHPLPFPVLIDSTGEARQSYRVESVPATFLIDGGGRVVERIDGETDWSTRVVRDTIEAFLRAAREGATDGG